MSMNKPSCLFAVMALTVLATAQPAFAQDAKHGSDVFKEQCAECHSPRDGKNKKGPSLFNVVGRKAASLSDMEYSDAMRATGWNWTDDRLRSYLSQPAKKAVPGTKMKFDGLSNEHDLADLLAYLATLK